MPIEEKNVIYDLGCAKCSNFVKYLAYLIIFFPSPSITKYVEKPPSK